MAKDKPWIFGFFGAILFFGVFETLGFVAPDKYDTLSHFVAVIGRDWPFAIWLMGGVTFGLAVHFFWPWKANPIGAGGG